MCVTICGRFGSNERGVAGYADRMRDKYTAKWGVQMAGMNFQTRSKLTCLLTQTPLWMKVRCSVPAALPHLMLE